MVEIPETQEQFLGRRAALLGIFHTEFDCAMSQFAFVFKFYPGWHPIQRNKSRTLLINDGERRRFRVLPHLSSASTFRS